jgi:hypothetical protein
MIELSVVEVKPFDIWPFVRLAYSVVLSCGVAWTLYQNISTEQSRPWLLTTGVGFLICMAIVWLTLLRTPMVRKTQYAESKEEHAFIDWQLVTKISAQAFFVATILVTFASAPFDRSIMILLAGVMQAMRLASILYLVRVRDQYSKAMEALTGQPGIIWICSHLCH